MARWRHFPPMHSLVHILFRIGPCVFAFAASFVADAATPLEGTQSLSAEGDLASQMVDGIDRFLLRKTAEATANRERSWKPDGSSVEAWQKSLEPHRARLAKILGVRDSRASVPRMELLATPEQSSVVGRGKGYEIHAVRWPAFADVNGEGLLLIPLGRVPVADVVAIPDASQTPEQLCGLAPGVVPQSQFARRLAESGCRVLVPSIVDRNRGPHIGRARQSARQFLYSSAFSLGRHLIGYELQKVLAGVDYLESREGPARPVGVIGWGDGGMLALYAGVLDSRIDVVCVSGYFDERSAVWREPIDRNVFGLLGNFGDAELAAMIAPRALVLDAAAGPMLELTTADGGAPGVLEAQSVASVNSEIDRARRLSGALNPASFIQYVERGSDRSFCDDRVLGVVLNELSPELKPAPDSGAPAISGAVPSASARQARQFAEIDRHNQQMLVRSPEVRADFMKRLDTGTVAAFSESVEWYREYFATEVIGRFEEKPLPFNARSRKVAENEKWTSYDVVLDVFPDVFAYGVLLVPRGIPAGERRPVVVCQHGLEGRPQDVISGDNPSYHDFAAKLAERGFVTFSPQNPYIFKDRFRSLQRKANPLGKTLFSVIVPQHQQIVDWLQTQPFVDPERIAFYGLSYGGKSAMRIPPLVKDYALSICSADFNEWVGKNAATTGTMARYSYVFTGEYEIFEFDLGSTFNYAEMAALIAPRPFMVERGHFDGVAPDEAVSWEFAKVRHLYAAKLKLPDRVEMETFAGPHTIHGHGTFDFLHRHLKWPKPPE